MIEFLTRATVSPPEGLDASGLAELRRREAQRAAVGNQGGGRVMFFLETNNFPRDHAAMIEQGVKFLEEPRNEAYGSVAVFQDLYGNKWDLIQPKR